VWLPCRATASTPLLPYTPLFRSLIVEASRPDSSLSGSQARIILWPDSRHPLPARCQSQTWIRRWLGRARSRPHPLPPPSDQSGRSEEHTSELQSRDNVVCRLLLE